jgi:NADPH:quinone reductase-like Zn-dependent oxidoreductase
MFAAVVEDFGRPPRYREFPEPTLDSTDVLVEVRAAALSQLVRAQAAGRHYSSGTPPCVPGIDGVGVRADGTRVYFAFPRAPYGAMAERVAVDGVYTFALPPGVDDVVAAAIANPGMSSWAALNERRLAIQIARYLGASRVVATGRQPSSEAEMRALGADGFIVSSQPREDLVRRFRDEIARGIDVVLDYVWGPSAEAFLAAASTHGAGDASPRIRFVNIGSMGGAGLELQAGVLRSSGVELMGSGLGSVSHRALVGAIAGMMSAVEPAGLTIETTAVPLRDVETAWHHHGRGRVVLTM